MEIFITLVLVAAFAAAIYIAVTDREDTTGGAEGQPREGGGGRGDLTVDQFER